GSGDHPQAATTSWRTAGSGWNSHHTNEPRHQTVEMDLTLDSAAPHSLDGVGRRPRPQPLPDHPFGADPLTAFAADSAVQRTAGHLDYYRGGKHDGRGWKSHLGRIRNHSRFDVLLRAAGRSLHRRHRSWLELHPSLAFFAVNYRWQITPC